MDPECDDAVLTPRNRTAVVAEPGDCEFCAKARSTKSREWYDYHVLVDLGWCHIVPPLGSLVPGHLMVVLAVHHRSFSGIPAHMLAKAERLLATMQGTYGRIWPGGTGVLLFEHGTGAGGGPNCIEHAHVHVAPGLAHLADRLLPANHITAESVSQAADLYPDTGYVATWAHGTFRLAADAGLESQYFRKMIRRMQDRPDDWDYLAFPELDHVCSTVTRFRENPDFVEILEDISS